MVKIIDKNKSRIRRHKRVRSKITGTAECPRLNVFRSSQHIYAQVIDDVKGVTLAAASSTEKGFEGFDEGHELTPVLEDLLAKDDPDYAGKPDIKWNFTKFLVDREGNVVRRFETTASIPDVVAPAVEELL